MRDSLFDGCGFARHLGQLVKMLITFEPHGIFGSNSILVYLYIVQPLVCKTVARLQYTFLFIVGNITISWLLGEFKT